MLCTPWKRLPTRCGRGKQKKNSCSFQVEWTCWTGTEIIRKELRDTYTATLLKIPTLLQKDSWNHTHKACPTQSLLYKRKHKVARGFSTGQQPQSLMHVAQKPKIFSLKYSHCRHTFNDPTNRVYNSITCLWPFNSKCNKMTWYFLTRYCVHI